MQLEWLWLLISQHNHFLPILMKMIISKPILMSTRTNLLKQPSQPEIKHRLYNKLTKMVTCTIRRHQSQGFSEDAIKLLLASWQTQTRKAYAKYRYIRMWREYTNRKKIDPVSLFLSSAVNFLADFFYKWSMLLQSLHD